MPVGATENASPVFGAHPLIRSVLAGEVCHFGCQFCGLGMAEHRDQLFRQLEVVYRLFTLNPQKL